MLLIITNKEDFAADFLIVELIERKLPYFRLNSEEVADYSVSFVYKNDDFESSFKLHDKYLDLSKIQTIWYRRTIHPLLKYQEDTKTKKFAFGELQHLFEGLLLNDSIQWINPFDSVIKAERKIYQLKVASKLGFKIPETLISNNIKEIQDFSQNSSIICKPIYHGLLYDPNESYAVYANRITYKELDINSISFPTYFQREISKKSDIRVTIIGNDIFSVEIIGDYQISPDWRRKNAKLKYKIIKLPSKLQRLCFRLVKALNLQYGAVDFVRTHSGEFFFLEINPTGEWAWLENELGIPMRESLIKLFYQQ